MAFWRRASRSGNPSPSAVSSVDVRTFYSRNFAFVSPDVQSALNEQTIFFAGVGLASNIAVSACRTGFSRFILADGDNVELSNLNRQAYAVGDIGRNKAEALADILRSIRPDVTVEVVPRMLDGAACVELMARADMVVNSIEFDQPACFILNRYAQQTDKYALVPINLGWGGAAIVFTPTTPSFESFIGYDPRIHAPEAVVSLLIARIFAATGQVPSYLSELLTQYLTGSVAWPYDPQLGVASALTSALTVRALVALAADEPLRVAPSVLYADARALGEPIPATAAPVLARTSSVQAS